MENILLWLAVYAPFFPLAFYCLILLALFPGVHLKSWYYGAGSLVAFLCAFGVFLRIGYGFGSTGLPFMLYFWAALGFLWLFVSIGLICARKNSES